MEIKKDFFAHKAQDYEKESRRVNNVRNIANGILNTFTYDKSMHIMDFGSGTGLLTEHIAPFVEKITAVDMSASMNEVLKSKIPTFPCFLEVIETDLTQTVLERSFDGIISSMTLHHIEDIEALFYKFYSMLHKNGTIALADLDKEDGSFHTENTGVHHFGFERDFIFNHAKNAGFQDINIDTVSIAQKPYGDFPIFLITARK